MIERKIIIGLITSTEFIREILPIWDAKLIQGPEIKRIARWCMEYYAQYNEAPGKHIETIFYTKIKEDKVPEDVAELIEDILLPGLSDEYEEGINYRYLVDSTKKLFRERSLEMHSASIKELLEDGEVEQAEALAKQYQIKQDEPPNEVDLSKEEALDKMRNAFNSASVPVVQFPGPLGEMWNEHFVRGGLIGLQGPEKRGKTFRLLQIAIDGCRQKKKVAFFQAGDMTEDQQLQRIGVCLAQKSNKEKYCGEIYKPVKDCIHNQSDSCTRKERECDFGVWDMDELQEMEEDIRGHVNLTQLKEKFEEYPDYKPCHNCSQYWKNQWGTPWLQKTVIKNPLEAEEAVKLTEKFFIKNKRRFKISTHANGTLSVEDIEKIIETWIKRDDFVPDLIVVDYADLLVSSSKEFRHKQDDIWKGLRRLSQTYYCLVVTATQTDAASYDTDTITLKNFSEDKRKYAHVTGMFGLNQDRHGREEELGIIRINELATRDGEKIRRSVHILQSLKTGQPYISSYW